MIGTKRFRTVAVGLAMGLTSLLPAAPARAQCQMGSQRQQTSAQQNTFQSFQTGTLNGFPTTSQEVQFLTAVQTALQQTQAMLTTLEQPNLLANQKSWIQTIQRQATALTGLSQQSTSPGTTKE